MTNIVGLTNHSTGQKIMVNADQIAYFQSIVQDDLTGKVEPLLDARFAEGQTLTEVLMVGGAYLIVREDMFHIVDMIEPKPDYDARKQTDMAASRGVFVGYDDITDWVWDMLPPGQENDYLTSLIVEEIIDTWPALVGWHAEVAKGAAIDAVIDEGRFWEIARKNPAD